MGIIFIYTILWLISFLWLLHVEEKIHESTNHWITPATYAIACVIASFLLLGILDMGHSLYLKVKRYVMWKFTLFVIQRKISKMAKAHPENQGLQDIVQQVKDLRKENPNDK